MCCRTDLMIANSLSKDNVNQKGNKDVDKAIRPHYNDEKDARRNLYLHR